jgi:hypothetical protein
VCHDKKSALTLTRKKKLKQKTQYLLAEKLIFTESLADLLIGIEGSSCRHEQALVMRTLFTLSGQKRSKLL